MRCAALLLLLAGACSSAADDELAAVKSAHSIVAEWAAVARLQADGRVGEIYAQRMADDARSQLASERKELRGPGDPAGRLIDGLTGATPDATRLAFAARQLAQLERDREIR